MRTLQILAVSLLTIAAQAADVVIDSTPPTSFIGPFADSAVESTWGQTFISPVSGTLDRFYLDMLVTDPGEFKFFVYAWDGFAATGLPLFESPVQTPASGSLGLEFDLAVPVTQDSQYVGFVSAANFQNSGLPLSALIGFTTDDYAGGSMLFQPSGAFFDPTGNVPWIDTGLDTSFRAEFTSSAVPEARSIIGVLGLAVLIAGSRLGRHQKHV